MDILDYFFVMLRSTSLNQGTCVRPDFFKLPSSDVMAVFAADSLYRPYLRWCEPVIFAERYANAEICTLLWLCVECYTDSAACFQDLRRYGSFYRRD